MKTQPSFHSMLKACCPNRKGTKGTQSTKGLHAGVRGILQNWTLLRPGSTCAKASAYAQKLRRDKPVGQAGALRHLGIAFLSVALVALMNCSIPVRAQVIINRQDASADFAYNVPFELGHSEFAPGDSITITALRGTSDVIATNQTYCVEGVYTLASADEADLCFYATISNPNPTPVDPRQRVRIQKGTGNFRLIKTVAELGYLHLSFYPVPGGSDLGGIYFGQGEWVRRAPWGKGGGQSTFNNRLQRIVSRAKIQAANQTIYDYLGEPVAPPQNLNAAYTSDGLTNAIQAAAQSAGVAVQRVEIDDSEFPFLIGVTAATEDDYQKLIEQLKKTPGYEYGGSVGGSGRHAFSLTPYHAFPSESAQRISHRLTLRMQIFCDKIVSE
jgi:hypothetical protein